METWRALSMVLDVLYRASQSGSMGPTIDCLPRELLKNIAGRLAFPGGCAPEDMRVPLYTLEPFREVCRLWRDVGREVVNSLTLFYHEEDVHAARFIAFFPNLSRLSLYGCRSEWFDDALTTLLRRPLQLQKLVLNEDTDEKAGEVPIVLPDSMAAFVELRRLELQFCHLETLPDCVGSMAKLETVALHGSLNLSRLPPTVQQWKALRFVSFEGTECNLRLPPEVKFWVMLEEADFEDCEAMTGLPEEVGCWSQLRRLCLRKCSALKALPASVSGWKAVESVDMEGCMVLETLLEGVGLWRAVRHIDLGGCKLLKSLPADIGMWPFTHCEFELIVDEGPLTEQVEVLKMLCGSVTPIFEGIGHECRHYKVSVSIPGCM
jgi:hypothetical protein